MLLPLSVSASGHLPLTPKGDAVSHSPWYAELVNGSVNPPRGDDLATYNFSIEFRDPADLIPTKVEAVIDGAAANMTELDPSDMSTIDGKLYFHRTDALSPYLHSFSFIASDFSGPIASSGTFEGPYVVPGPPDHIHFERDYLEAIIGSELNLKVRWQDAKHYELDGPPPTWWVSPVGGFLELTASWTVVNPMNDWRTGHSAHLLSNGSVLAAGGSEDSTVRGSVEIYEPSTSQWFRTADLLTPRSGHVATRLDDGRVLVAGGSTAAGLTNATELFDPVAQKWMTAPPMGLARVGATVSVLASGKVLVAGGDTPEGLTATAELFDPANGSWTAAKNMSRARSNHRATVLLDGRVLVSGGWLGSVPTGSVELFDPIGEDWSTAASMSAPRHLHTATLLESGLVLAAGGGTLTGSTASCELFDPATGVWRNTGWLSGGTAGHSATLLLDGSVMLVGGESAARFDPVAEKWRPAGSTGQRYTHTSTLLPDGGLLVAGGTWGRHQSVIYDPTHSQEATLYVGNMAGTFEVFANESGKSSIATVKVLPGPHATIEVKPPSVNLSAGEVQEFWAEAADSYGNRIDQVHAIWSTSGGGQIDRNGRFVATISGSWTVTATAGNVRGNATVIVNPGPPVTIEVEPRSITLEVGETAQFLASLFDVQGNLYEPASAEWRVSGEGSITPSGTFFATSSGEATVYGTSAGLTGTAKVTIVKSRANATDMAPDLSILGRLLAAVVFAVLLLVAWLRRPNRDPKKGVEVSRQGGESEKEGDSTPSKHDGLKQTGHDHREKSYENDQLLSSNRFE